MLCSKCRAIFATSHHINRIKHGYIYKDDTWMKTYQHSPSISLLRETVLSNCHLCILLWEAMPAYFEELSDHEHKTNSFIEVRFMFQKARGRIGSHSLTWWSRSEPHWQFRPLCDSPIRLIFAVSQSHAWAENKFRLINFERKNKGKIISFWMSLGWHHFLFLSSEIDAS